MKKPLQKIEELIPILPKKDAILASKFLKERNFECILELVQSDLYKLEKLNSECKEPNDDIIMLEELRSELVNYMSYLDIPDNSDDYDCFV